MNWTTKKPTKTGWYWYRGVSDGNTAKVLHFIDDDGEEPYLATSDDQTLNDLAGEWAGWLSRHCRVRVVEQDGPAEIRW